MFSILKINPSPFRRDNRAAGTVELKLQGIYRTTEKTPVLKSTAKSIDDTWSVKGMTQPSSGGGTQVFSSAKGNFEKTQLFIKI
ncbi:polymorphic toxin type 46 domain-containing protein [Pseudomonas prosekii]|uniref:polymorphic toxin type 46 domain-containing protein n=1 Tax=Pseudomonas prosekii TaxID=1148509 RepID=UPI000B8705AE|nr:polymorphic toxin type 46 domain-containing protein [Pseudomonas prosekii]